MVRCYSPTAYRRQRPRGAGTGAVRVNTVSPMLIAAPLWTVADERGPPSGSRLLRRHV
jgi:hypothetical protein